MKFIKTLSLLICMLGVTYAAYYLIYKTDNINAQKYYVGVSLPLSGPQEKEGKQLLKAIELMQHRVNTNQEIGINTTLELVVRDDKNDPALAKNIAEEFVKNGKVFAVIGPLYSSTFAGGAQEVYAENKIITISPYESNAHLNFHSPYAFNMTYTNSAGAEHMAVYTKEITGKDNVLVIYKDDEFGESYRAAFNKKANNIGLKIYKEISCDDNEKNDDKFIENHLKAEDKDKIKSIVLFTRTNTGIRLIQKLRKFGVSAMVIGPHTFLSDKFLESADGAAPAAAAKNDNDANESYIATPFLYELANEESIKFRDEYIKKYAEKPEASTALAADAILLLAEALKNKVDIVGQRDKKNSLNETVRNYLHSLSWYTAVDGLTGNLFFNKENHVERDIFVVQIYEGKFVSAFTQLTKPREKHILDKLKTDEEIKEFGYLLSDKQAYNVVDVVYVGLDYIKIDDIDPKTMMFNTELFLWFKWANDKLDVKGIKFINMMQKKKYTLIDKFGEKGEMKYAAYKVDATFFVPFNLRKFPFDTQSLPIYIAHKNLSSNTMMLVLDEGYMDRTPITDINPAEWNFKSMEKSSILYRFKSTFGNPQYAGKNYKSKVYFSTVKAEVKVERNLLPYVLNMFLPLVVIVLISCLILKIPVDQFVLRTSTTSAAIMSILLYYVAQKSMLPKVGYMMKADYYFLLLFIFILCLQSFNILLNKYFTRTNVVLAEKLNIRFAITFVALTIASYVAITVML